MRIIPLLALFPKMWHTRAMAKSSKPKIPNSKKQETDLITDYIGLDAWEVLDQGDQHFWEEFFQIEELVSNTDELDPPSFTITVQNHQTGEVKTYKKIYLKSARKKTFC